MPKIASATSIGLLNQVGFNKKKQDKFMQNVASGMKINGASDDASGYQISERMRAQLRSLKQAKQNTQNGSSLLNVAAGGIQTIVENLKTMKELALRSANGIYNDNDRLAMEEEFKSCQDAIDSSADTTTYNSKILLDGTYRNQDLRSVDSVDEPQSIKGSISAADAGEYTISQEGIYQVDAGFTGTIKIDATNVQLIETGSNMTNVNIECEREGMNLSLSNVFITNDSSYKNSILKFTGIGNSLTLSGTCGFQYNALSSNAVLNIGQELEITNHDSLTVNNSGLGFGAAIGTNSNETAKRLTIAGGTLNVGSYSSGAAIGAGSGGGIDTINLINVKLDQVATNGASAAIGCGVGTSKVGNITLSGCSGKVNTLAFQGEFGQNEAGTGSVGRTLVFDSSILFNSKLLDNTNLQPLQLQTGVRADGKMNIYLNKLDCDSLGIDVLSVTTEQKAKIAMKRLNSSLDYALHESTRIGAYINRLDYTEANNTTEYENVTCAESAIRDADMAKEMVSYTKYQVLWQASQAMLAQANQQRSNILNLLQ